jgi:hypothetical protein
VSREYVPLSVTFFEDDRIMEVTPSARLVFIGGLCVAKRNESDGLLTFAQVRRECPDVGDLEPLIAELISRGLWTRDDDRTFTITSWLKWNKSREWLDEVRAKRAKSGQIGGQRSGQARAVKQLASPGSSKLLEKSKLRQDKTIEEKTPDQTAGADGVADKEDDPRLHHVVELLARKALDRAADVANPARYLAATARTIRRERGVELRALLTERPSARAESIADLVESGGLTLNGNGSRPLSPLARLERDLEIAERSADPEDAQAARERLDAYLSQQRERQVAP